jgi:hypothetical protein
MEDGAYCAAAWAGGQKQIDIARSMGMKHSSAVCVAIGKFLDEWSGQRVRHMELLECYEQEPWEVARGLRPIHKTVQVCGDDRKRLVAQALARFSAERRSLMLASVT